jgi:hypothetical protein
MLAGMRSECCGGDVQPEPRAAQPSCGPRLRAGLGLAELDSCLYRPYQWTMPPRPRSPSSDNPKAAASRSWRASLIRSKAQVFGHVEAPSREAAEAAAVRTFNLNPEQSSRLVVQERAKYYE